MSFWSDKLNGPRTPAPGPVQPPTQSPQPAWWRPQSPPQGQPGASQPVPPPGVPQELAVRQYQPAMTAEQQLRATQGYAKRAPEWVKYQPTDFCPNCGGVNYAQLGSGDKYHGLANGQVFLRCFDCGYSNKGVMNTLSGLPSSGEVVGAARQVPDGGGKVNNFHPKEIVGRVG